MVLLISFIFIHTYMHLYMCLYTHTHTHKHILSFIHSFYFFQGTAAPSGPGPPHCQGFMITRGHTTLSRTFLDEWSAWHRGLYLKTHNTHKRQTSMRLLRDWNPQSQQVSGSCLSLRPRGHWDQRTRTHARARAHIHTHTPSSSSSSSSGILTRVGCQLVKSCLFTLLP